MNLNQEITFADVARLVRRAAPGGLGGRGRRSRRPEQRELHRDVVGLKIGASKIAAAYVVNNGSAELRTVACDPLEGGYVVNGELRDVDGLARELAAFFERHALPRSGVRLGVANSRIGVRSFEIEGVSDEPQLENAVRFRAQELLPIPLDEAVLDYQVIDRVPQDDGSVTYKVLLVVAHRELVERYVEACRQAGIGLAGIDLEAFGLLRALERPDAADATPAALIGVSLGHERSTFAVSDGRTCEFARVLAWGGATLTAAIARTLAIPAPEAEAVKRSLSLLPDAAAPAGLDEDQARRVAEAVKAELHAFARELVSSLQFYQGQPGSLPISELVLTGGTASIPGLDAHLQRLVGVPVRVGDPLARVNVVSPIQLAQPLSATTVAIGLAIEE